LNKTLYLIHLFYIHYKTLFLVSINSIYAFLLQNLFLLPIAANSRISSVRLSYISIRDYSGFWEARERNFHVA